MRPGRAGIQGRGLQELRAAAVAGITDAGSAAVGELLPILETRRGTKQYQYLQAAMRALGRDAHGPLLGALQAPDNQIQAAAIRSLADLGVQTAIPFLCRPALVGDSADVVHAARAVPAVEHAPRAVHQAVNENLLFIGHFASTTSKATISHRIRCLARCNRDSTALSLMPRCSAIC